MDFETVPAHGPEVGTFRKECRAFVLDRDNWTCHYCSAQLDRDGQGELNSPTVDHIVPLSKGGTWAASNLVACCNWCNTEKDTLDYNAFVAKAPWQDGRITREPHSRYVNRGLKILTKIEKGICHIDFDSWLHSIPGKYQQLVRQEIMSGD